MVLGIISDTHGLLRPSAINALRECPQVIHAGDIGSIEVLDALRALAPTTAVRGNVDRGGWAKALRDTETLSLGGVTIHVLHDLHALAIDPAKSGVRIVISGHSHKPHIEEKGGTLFLNPGAAGPRRFRLPVTLAHVQIHRDGRIDTRLIDLLGV